MSRPAGSGLLPGLFPGLLTGLLTGVVATASGGLVAALGLFAHRDAARVGGVEVPWGLVLSLLTVFAVVAAAGSLVGAPTAACAAGGWVILLLLALRGRPEGDYLLAADGTGEGFLWGGLVTVGVAFWVALRLEPPTGG